MADTQSGRAPILRDFEAEAELLVVHQLDLLAQIEAQLRAVHHTMRRIERLRNAKSRVGPSLSNGERRAILMALSSELQEVDRHLLEQYECCGLMQESVRQMQQRLITLQQVTDRLNHPSEDAEPPDQGSIGA